MTAPLRVLLFGGTGQVGSELRRRSWPMPVALVTPGRAEADFSDPARLAETIRSLAPDLVVNSAAYTAVDKAEAEPELAHAVNAVAPGAIAFAAAARGAPLIHLSTDYVFDGRKTEAYREDDPINPLSVYGASKAAGEDAVRAAGERHVILRTSWVYGAIGHNFVKTMLRLGAERPQLSIVDDQWGAPTSAPDIADAVMTIARRLSGGEGGYGTFHFTAEGATTWYGFAKHIFSQSAAAGGCAPELTPISTDQYPTPARRPANSCLDCSKIADIHRPVRRPWAEALAEVMAELSLSQTKRHSSLS